MVIGAQFKRQGVVIRISVSLEYLGRVYGKVTRGSKGGMSE